MKQEIKIISKGLTFKTFDEWTSFFAGLEDGTYHISLDVKKIDIREFISAQANRSDIARRLRNPKVIFEVRLIGPSKYEFKILGNDKIPAEWVNKTDVVRNMIAKMKPGEQIDINTLDFDKYYVRTLLTKINANAYTKTENGVTWIVKGEKPLSATKEIQRFIQTLGDTPKLLLVNKSVSFVRTTVSAMATDSVGYSVREAGPGQFVVTKKVKDFDSNSVAGITVDQLRAHLSPTDFAAVMHHIEYVRAKISAPAVPYDDETGIEYKDEESDDDIDDFLGEPEPIRRDAPAVPIKTVVIDDSENVIDNKPTASDPDNYDAGKLKTDYISDYFKDDEDLEF